MKYAGKIIENKRRNFVVFLRTKVYNITKQSKATSKGKGVI